MDYIFLKTTINEQKIVVRRIINKSKASKHGLSPYKVDLETYSNDSVSSEVQSINESESKDVLYGLLSKNNSLKKINSTTKLHQLNSSGLGISDNNFRCEIMKNFSTKNVNQPLQNSMHHLKLQWEVERMIEPASRASSLSRSSFGKMFYSNKNNRVYNDKELELTNCKLREDFNSSCIEKHHDICYDYHNKLDETANPENKITDDNKSQLNTNKLNWFREQTCKNIFRILDNDSNINSSTQNTNENSHLSKHIIVNLNSPTISTANLKERSKTLKIQPKRLNDTFIERVETPDSIKEVPNNNGEHTIHKQHRKDNSICNIKYLTFSLFDLLIWVRKFQK